MNAAPTRSFISALGLRHLAAILIAMLLASACGGSSTALIGDTASSAQPTEPADSERNATERDDEDDAAEVAAAAQAETEGAEIDDAETEEEDPVAIVQVVAAGGAVDTFADFEISVLPTQATNSSTNEFLEGTPEPSNQFLLVVNLSTENLTQRVEQLNRSDMFLQDPAGREYKANRATRARSDETITAVSFDGRGTTEWRMVFGTDELVADASDWQLVVRGDEDDDLLPTILPLDGPAYAHNYPLALVDGAAGEFSTGDFTDCDGATFDTLVDRAQVVTEFRGEWSDAFAHRDASERAASGQRFIMIDLAISGRAETYAADGNFDRCGHPNDWPGFFLNVADREINPYRRTLPVVNGISTAAAQLVFEIPADATELTLIGGQNKTTVASWNVDLPLEVGEPGAEQVRDTGAFAEQFDDVGSFPADATTVELTNGGASGRIMLADVTLGDVSATTVVPQQLLEGRDEFSGDTWIVAEVEVVGDVGADWRYDAGHFLIVDPNGRVHQGLDLFEADGEDMTTVVIAGEERQVVNVMFRTNGLVTDPDGWSFLVDHGDAEPLELPFVGEAANDWPEPLTSGQTATLSYAQPFGCDLSVLEAEVTQARIDIEGPRTGLAGFTLDVTRATPEQIAIVVDLSLTNPTDDGGQLCGWLTVWPDFPMNVDGRLISPMEHRTGLIDPFTTETLELTYIVPRDSQTASLVLPGGDLGEWQLKGAQEVLSDFGAAQANERTLITLEETLLFAFGESTLQQGATAPLNRVASILLSESAGDVEIVGHTDSIGDDDANQALSLARAEAVAAALVAAGVDESRLVVSGQGESSPIAPNETDDGDDNPAGRAENRRVEILFSTS